MVPPCGDKDSLPGLLDNLNRHDIIESRVSLTRPLALPCAQESTVSIVQMSALRWWEEHPMFPTAHIGRPRVGAENIDVEWRPRTLRAEVNESRVGDRLRNPQEPRASKNLCLSAGKQML